MVEVVYALIGMRLAIIVVGSALGIFAFLRFLRGGFQGHLLLALGFGLLSVGAVAEGVTFEIFSWNLVAAHSIEAAFSAAGLLSVLLAILLSRR